MQFSHDEGVTSSKSADNAFRDNTIYKPMGLKMKRTMHKGSLTTNQAGKLLKTETFAWM